METEEIMTQLRRFVRSQYSIPDNDPDFSDDVDLFNYGYVDSISAVQLMAFVETQFGIKFTDADWLGFPLNSIAQIAGFVAKRRKGEV